MKMISCHRLYMTHLLNQLYKSCVELFYSIEELFCLDSDYRLISDEVVEVAIRP